MRQLLLLIWLCVGLLSGCRNERPAAPVTPGRPGAPRRVEISVSNQGYTPTQIAGQPGEPLVLVFRYDTSAGECGKEVLLPDQRKIELSPEHPVEVALTLPPKKGRLDFTCGMQMLRGTLVVE